MLKENGITFCYHIHGYEFQPYEKGTLLDYMIQNTKPEYVSFEMDVLWTHFGGGDPVALLKKYKQRFKLLHVKDLRKGTPKDLSGGTSQENDVALGTGEIDIPGIIPDPADRVDMPHRNRIFRCGIGRGFIFDAGGIDFGQRLLSFDLSLIFITEATVWALDDITGQFR